MATKPVSVAFSLMLALALSAMPALAHRVNVFAWLEGGAVVVEAGFNRSSPARNSTIRVFALTAGQDAAPLLSGTTDARGKFSFPVPANAGKTGLRIRILAGEGHENEFVMPPADFIGLAPAPAKEQGAAPPPPPADPAQVKQGVSTAEMQLMLRDVMDDALERKLAPIRRSLAELSGEGGVRLADVVGGIGWILGLTGIALYFRSRRKTGGHA